MRERTESELVRLARKRIRRLASYGVGTIEVKSGYGLTLDDELKLLRVIQKLSKELPVRLVPTFLGAHEIPLDHRYTAARRREEFLAMLSHELRNPLAAVVSASRVMQSQTVAELKVALGKSFDVVAEACFGVSPSSTEKPPEETRRGPDALAATRAVAFGPAMRIA